MKKIISIVTFSLFAFSLMAQTNSKDSCACCSPNHQAFDFWEGNWEVFDSLGNKLGENQIVKIQDNCLLQENWKSASMTGTSYNYYNSVDSTWNQLWIDNKGSQLILKGKASKDKMVLKSELLKGQKVDFYYNQITWTKNEDGSVKQLWEIMSVEHQPLLVAFNGIYRLKKNSRDENIKK